MKVLACDKEGWEWEPERERERERETDRDRETTREADVKLIWRNTKVFYDSITLNRSFATGILSEIYW